jgi:hypothetical protein
VRKKEERKEERHKATTRRDNAINKEEYRKRNK